MNRSRWMIALVVIAIAGIAVAGATVQRGHHESEANDPDRNAEAHVGSKPGYQLHNQVRVLAAAPAAGWVGESKLAVEDTWEPYVAADPTTPYVYAIYNRYGARCGKSSCPSPQMMVSFPPDPVMSRFLSSRAPATMRSLPAAPSTKI